MRVEGLRQCVPHGVHPAALLGGPEHLGGGSLGAHMGAADHELDPTLPALLQAAQELDLGRFGLAGPDLQTYHLALALEG